ncbi:MAG: polysaccharide biosynthesis/export family protein [Cyanobacteria bacterium J06648_16]
MKLFLPTAQQIMAVVPLLILAKASPSLAQLPELPTSTPTTADETAQAPIPVEMPATIDSSAIPLKTGDRLSIAVVGFPDLSGDHIVSPDGTIQMPLVGYVSVSGLTPAQVVPQLTELLRPYVRRPQVGLAVTDLSPVRISITGAVVEPGPRLLSATSEGEGRTITLSDTLVMAGGITPDADLRNITIRRTTGTGSAPTEVQVDLWEAIRDGDLDADPKIFDGDEVIVPKATASNVDQQMLLASTVAPDEITIHVAGEVERPGQIDITPSADVSAAIAAAGGLTPDADANELVLFRMAPDGRLAEQTFAFGDVSTTLMQGDLVVVKPSSRGNVGDNFDFLGRILGPFGFLFRLLD